MEAGRGLYKRLLPITALALSVVPMDGWDSAVDRVLDGAQV